MKRILLTLWWLIQPRCAVDPTHGRGTHNLGGFRYCRECRDALVRNLVEDLKLTVGYAREIAKVRPNDKT